MNTDSFLNSQHEAEAFPGPPPSPSGTPGLGAFRTGRSGLVRRDRRSPFPHREGPVRGRDRARRDHDDASRRAKPPGALPSRKRWSASNSTCAMASWTIGPGCVSSFRSGASGIPRGQEPLQTHDGVPHDGSSTTLPLRFSPQSAKCPQRSCKARGNLTSPTPLGSSSPKPSRRKRPQARDHEEPRAGRIGPALHPCAVRLPKIAGLTRRCTRHV